MDEIGQQTVFLVFNLFVNMYKMKHSKNDENNND